MPATDRIGKRASDRTFARTVRSTLFARKFVAGISQKTTQAVLHNRLSIHMIPKARKGECRKPLI